MQDHLGECLSFVALFRRPAPMHLCLLQGRRASKITLEPPSGRAFTVDRYDVGDIAAVDQEPAEASLISVAVTAGHHADGPGLADQRLQLARRQIGLMLGLALGIIGLDASRPCTFRARRRS
jgi:hypothetical protein